MIRDMGQFKNEFSNIKQLLSLLKITRRTDINTYIITFLKKKKKTWLRDMCESKN